MTAAGSGAQAAGGHARRQKRLIRAHRRLFNHVEHGINIPANASTMRAPRLRDRGGCARSASWARLRGRAVQPRHRHLPAGGLQGLGIEIATDNPLMHARMRRLPAGRSALAAWCCTAAATRASRTVGRAFRAFSVPGREDRLREPLHQDRPGAARVDRIAAVMAATFATTPLFRGIEPLVFEFASPRSSARRPWHRPDIFGRVGGVRHRLGERLAALTPASAQATTRYPPAFRRRRPVPDPAGRNLVTDIIPHA